MKKGKLRQPKAKPERITRNFASEIKKRAPSSKFAGTKFCTKIDPVWALGPNIHVRDICGKTTVYKSCACLGHCFVCSEWSNSVKRKHATQNEWPEYFFTLAEISIVIIL